MDAEEDKLTILEGILNYHFRDKSLLILALAHSTFAYESQEKEIFDNQRLEFLGDSILGMVVAEHLYTKYPNFAEGELTRRRSLLVNKNNLARKAKEINISQYLLLGKGEEKRGGRENLANLSAALEAVIGAIYLDGGFEEAREFIMNKIVTEPSVNNQMSPDNHEKQGII